MLPKTYGYATQLIIDDQEPTVEQVYRMVGVAWYYILDTINQRFKLPRTKFGFTGLRDTVGGYVEPGVPNLNGYLGSPAFTALGGTDGILFKNTSVHAAVVAGGGWDAYQIGFDASRVSSVYNNSNTVQPPATQMYLYFYVGQFTQTATQNTAGLNAELFNGKADVSTVAHVVTEFQAPTAANNYTWYRKYADGWVEQGGLKNHSTGTIDITLPITMADTNYSVLGSFGTGYSAANNNNFVLVAYSTTVIRLTDNNAGSMYWFVAGIAA